MKERPILFSGPMVRAISPKMQEWNASRRIHIDDNQIEAMFNAGKTAAEIADIVGCSTCPVKKALKKLGLRRPAKRRAGKACGQNNPAWKGGRRLRLDGYVVVWTPNGNRLEHQVVMEKSICRKLSSGEIVHHRDGNKENNSIENLELMTQSEHAKHHSPEMHAARYGK